MKSNIIELPKAPKLTIFMPADDRNGEDKATSHIFFDVDNDFLVRLSDCQAQAELMDVSITFTAPGGKSLDTRNLHLNIWVNGQGRMDVRILGHQNKQNMVGTGFLTVDFVRRGLGVCERFDEQEGFGLMFDNGANLIIIDRIRVQKVDDGPFGVEHGLEIGTECSYLDIILSASEAVLQ